MIALLREWERSRGLWRAALCAVAALAAVLFLDEVRHSRDFGGYVLVGRLVLQGRDIYRDAAPGLNTWPPFFSIFCVPLALLDGLSRLLARAAWLCLNYALVLASLSILVQIVYGRRLGWREGPGVLPIASPQVLVPLLLTSRYLTSNFEHLQVNLVIFFLALAGMYWQANGREFAGGLALGTAAALKLMPALFIPYLMWRGRRRAAAYATGAGALLSVSPALVLGWSGYVDSLVAWRQALAAGWSVGKMNQSVYAMWDRYLGHGLVPFFSEPQNAIPRSGEAPVVVATAVSLAAVVVIALWVCRHAPKGPVAELAEWSVVFMVSAVFGPVAWKAYLVSALAPNVLLFAGCRSPALPPAARRLIGSLLVAAFLLGGISRGLVGKRIAWNLEMASAVTLAALLLLAAALVMRARGEKTGASSIGDRGPSFQIRRRPTLPCGDRIVPSALEGLTSVFGMGTGVTPPRKPPET